MIGTVSGAKTPDCAAARGAQLTAILPLKAERHTSPYEQTEFCLVSRTFMHTILKSLRMIFQPHGK